MNNIDYSFLFNNTKDSINNGLYSSLGDLYSIKSGTYKKLVSAYYKKMDGSEDDGSKKTDKKNPLDKTPVSSTSTELSKSADKIKTSANNLSNAANTLLNTGADSVFNARDMITKTDDGEEVTVKDIDRNAVYGAVKKFVDSYNSFLTNASDNPSDSVKKQVSNMVTSTVTSSKLLSNVGITIGSDNKLSIDESKFKNSDMNTVKTLFNSRNSFAYNASTKASMISSSASSEAEMQKLYGSDAKKNNTFSGTSWDSFF